MEGNYFLKLFLKTKYVFIWIRNKKKVRSSTLRLKQIPFQAILTTVRLSVPVSFADWKRKKNSLLSRPFLYEHHRQ